MRVLEVKVLEKTEDSVYKLKYLTEVKSGVIKRRVVYFKDGKLSKDTDDTSLLDLVIKEIKKYNKKNKTFKEM